MRTVERRKGRRRQVPREPMVLWAAAEAVPWASTGGLGDVTGSLPTALRHRHAAWDVRLVLPLYAGAVARPVKPPCVRFSIDAGGTGLPFAVREAVDPPGGVPTYFVECNPLFNRRGIYGEGGESYPDNTFRYGAWQLAVRRLATRLDPPPSILHCHDWHAALLPALLQWPGERPPELRDTRTILTIHNLLYQGQAGRDIVEALRLPGGLWHPRWIEHFGNANFIKAGILSADRITTVSPSYAREMATPEGGMGLDGPLHERAGDLVGILNGIDSLAWHPAGDPALPAPFDASNLAGRARCRLELRRELGLDGDAGDPLVGFIGRIADSKGVDLLVEAIPRILAAGAAVVALGNGDQFLERALLDVAARHPRAVRVLLRFDSPMARRMYAGADIMLVPSRYEPCGLVQLYSLRYGAVPVVRAAGGLRDTVEDGVNGFVFEEPTSAALVQTVRRAIDCFHDHPAWSELQLRGMKQDWSWERSADAYEALYREVLANPPRTRPAPRAEDSP